MKRSTSVLSNQGFAIDCGWVSGSVPMKQGSQIFRRQTTAHRLQYDGALNAYPCNSQGKPFLLRCRLLICMLLAAGLLSCDRHQPTRHLPAEAPKVENQVQKEPADPGHRDGDTLIAMKKRGEVRVGMQVGFVPFQMQGRDGNIVGFDVDTAELVSRAMMLNLRIVRKNWQELIPALLNGEIDVIMSAMTVTSTRNAEVLFTIPVLETGRMFIVHVKNAARLHNFKELDQPGIFVVSSPGGLGELNIRETLPKASYREFPTQKLALKEVLENRAHAFIDDEFSIRMAAATHSGALMPNFTPITYESISWAARPGEYHWLNWLDNFIRLLHKDGRLEQLKKKWFQDHFLDMHRGNGR